MEEYSFRVVTSESIELIVLSKADARHRSDAITSVAAFIELQSLLFMGKGYVWLMIGLRYGFQVLFVIIAIAF
jgi:divalent metal cation (Fe/Co/Zn/Cd) transporter